MSFRVPLSQNLFLAINTLNSHPLPYTNLYTPAKKLTQIISLSTLQVQAQTGKFTLPRATHIPTRLSLSHS